MASLQLAGIKLHFRTSPPTRPNAFTGLPRIEPMNERTSHHKCPPAFTLLELVVVVALLVVGAGMLLFALVRTRPNVRSVQCLNNLKQWGTVLQLYANNSGDNLPRDGMSATGIYPGSGDGTPNDLNAWFNLLPQLIAENTLQFYYNSGVGDQRTKLLFPYGKVSIQNCPIAYLLTV